MASDTRGDARIGGAESARGGRGSETPAQVLVMVAVLFGALALVAGFFALNRPEPALPDRVDYESVVRLVRDEYPYQVLAPASVPEGWRATSVDHAQQATGNRWRVGFLVDGTDYVGLEQTDGEVQSYLLDRLGGYDEDGRSGRWQRWVERGGVVRRALVRTDAGVVTIVRGTTSYDVLEEFVTWLE